MKILFVVRALPVHRLGGLENHGRDLAVALAERGHQVCLLTTTGGAAATLGPHRLRLEIREIPGTRPGDYSMVFFRRAEAAALDLHRQAPFDVIVPIDLAGLFMNAARFDVPVIPLIHGTMTSEVPLDWRHWRHLTLADKLRAAWRYKARLPLRRPFARMIRQAQDVIVDSEFTRRELLQQVAQVSLSAGRPTMHVVPLGIDMERYGEAAPVPKSSAPKAHTPLRIVMLGRLQKIKGIDIALRAVAQVRLRGIAVELHVGGSGEYLEAARHYAAQHGLTEAVHFHGRIPPEQLSAFLGSHDVFLFPDLTQPAFGLVAVEAMAHGLMVVAADAGAIPEVVTDCCGCLYYPWDVGALAAILARLAVDRAEVERKRAAALARAKDFTVEKMASLTEEVLRGVTLKK